MVSFQLGMNVSLIKKSNNSLLRLIHGFIVANRRFTPPAAQIVGFVIFARIYAAWIRCRKPLNADIFFFPKNIVEDWRQHVHFTCSIYVHAYLAIDTSNCSISIWGFSILLHWTMSSAGQGALRKDPRVTWKSDKAARLSCEIQPKGMACVKMLNVEPQTIAELDIKTLIVVLTTNYTEYIWIL